MGSVALRWRTWRAGTTANLGTGTCVTCVGHGGAGVATGPGPTPLTFGADHAGVLVVSTVTLHPAQGPAVGQRELGPLALHLIQHDGPASWRRGKNGRGCRGGGTLGPGGGSAHRAAPQKPRRLHNPAVPGKRLLVSSTPPPPCVRMRVCLLPGTTDAGSELRLRHWATDEPCSHKAALLPKHHTFIL